MLRRGGWLVCSLVLTACSGGHVPFEVGGAGSPGGDPTSGTTGGSSGPESTTSQGSTSGLLPTTSGLLPTTSGPDSSTSGPTPTTTGVETGAASSGETGIPPSGLECDAEELQLIALANQARMAAGLPAAAVSDNLCAVAHRHVVDLVEQAPHEAGAECLLNSWSNAGDWTPCCYASSVDQGVCMWEKGRELTDYNGITFEAAVEANSPAAALAAIQADQDANVILMNIGIWDNSVWYVAGAGIYGGYAVLWYGDAPE